MKVLVLIPNKPNMHPDLLYRSIKMEILMCICKHGIELDVIRDFNGDGDQGIDELRDETGIGKADVDILRKRVLHTAPIRQRMIDQYLKPEHSHVLWIDADVIDYSPMLPRELLYTTGGTTITAPRVLLENFGERWYDTAGFVEEGHWCNLYPPYFAQTSKTVKLDSVGCVVMIPADVYRRGAKHINMDGFTDWLAICAFAKTIGIDSVCDQTQTVWHADLRKYTNEIMEDKKA